MALYLDFWKRLKHIATDQTSEMYFGSRMSRLVSTYLLIQMGLVFVYCQRHLRFMPNDVNVWSDNIYVNFTYFIDRSRSGADLNFNVLKPIEDVDIILEGSVKSKENQRYGVVGRSSFSLCNLFAMRKTSGIAMFIYSYIRSHGKIPDECPIKKGIYKLQKIWIPENLIPENFPELLFDIKLEADIIENGDPVRIFNGSVDGDVLYKDLQKGNQRRLSPTIGG